MTKLRDMLVIGIVLLVTLAVSACLEIATYLEEVEPVATTPAVATSPDETAANATDSDNRIEKAPVAATPAGDPRPIEVDVVPVRNHSVIALSNTSADEKDPVWSPDGSKIAVVTTKLRKSGSNHDIHIINLPTTGGLKNKD